MAKSYYDILGVQKTASQDEIKSAHRKLARKYHPDLHPNDKAAAEKFKEVSEAYATLGDEAKRKDYDNPMSQFGRGGGAGAGGFGGFDFGGFGGGRGGGFSDFDINNIFSMFGAGGGTRGGSPYDDIQPIYTETTLTFEEAAYGATKEVEITRFESCTDCNGNGSKNGTAHEKCAGCGGAGSVRQVQETLFGRVASTRACYKCSGSGKTIKEVCPKCSGKGVNKITKKIRLTFPQGLEDNQQVSVRGEGNTAKNGIKGDLIIRVRVLRHKHFVRDGLNLIMNMPITFIQAAIGDKTEVLNLKNDRFALNIPEGTQHGTTLAIKNAGIAKGLRKGDILVNILIEIPKNISKSQKDTLKKLDTDIKLSQYDRVNRFRKE